MNKKGEHKAMSYHILRTCNWVFDLLCSGIGITAFISLIGLLLPQNNISSILSIEEQKKRQRLNDCRSHLRIVLYPFTANCFPDPDQGATKDGALSRLAALLGIAKPGLPPFQRHFSELKCRTSPGGAFHWEHQGLCHCSSPSRKWYWSSASSLSLVFAVWRSMFTFSGLMCLLQGT